MFRQFVRDFTNHGYRFVSPREVLDGLETEARAALITFDDGYYNNLRAVPLLEEFHVPAVFCISTNHVATGKAFWWDALYREALTLGWSSSRTDRVRSVLKLLPTRDAERQLSAEFGEAALRPVSDLDRPMTSKELANSRPIPWRTLATTLWTTPSSATIRALKSRNRLPARRTLSVD